MTDPVLLPAEGQSYERSAIAAWLQQHGTSPMTGQPADVETLMPNFALRNLLHALARRQQL
jgi:U-box domain